MTCTATGSALRNCRRLEGRRLVGNAGTTMMKTSFESGSTHVARATPGVQWAKKPPPSAAGRVIPAHSAASLSPSLSESTKALPGQTTAADAGAGNRASTRTAAATATSHVLVSDSTPRVALMALLRPARLLPGYQPDAVGAGDIRDAHWTAGKGLALQDAVQRDELLPRRDVRTFEASQREAEVEDHVRLPVSVHVCHVADRMPGLHMDFPGFRPVLTEPHGVGVDRRRIEARGTQDGHRKRLVGPAAPRVRKAAGLNVEGHFSHWRRT